MCELHSLSRWEVFASTRLAIYRKVGSRALGLVPLSASWLCLAIVDLVVLQARIRKVTGHLQ